MPLRSSVLWLVARMQERGDETLWSNSKKLNERYNTWIANYNIGNLLIIDTDHIDFKNNREDLGTIIEKINAEIHGLF
ncbi:MAG: deoxynucleoside kinase [Bacteroidales bacterium]|nr:deoxynucleoside kinase [Bacteroidales bacterium]